MSKRSVRQYGSVIRKGDRIRAEGLYADYFTKHGSVDLRDRPELDRNEALTNKIIEDENITSPTMKAVLGVQVRMAAQVGEIQYFKKGKKTKLCRRPRLVPEPEVQPTLPLPYRNRSSDRRQPAFA